MKQRCIRIGQLVLSVALIPLWFVKIFHGVGHLPSREDPGTIVQVDFYHSMIENMRDEGLMPLAVLSLVLLSCAAVLAALCLKWSQGKRLGRVSLVVFLAAVLLFLLCLLLASSVGRGY